MEKGKARKYQLLDISLSEFIAKGYYGTSTREIAQKAGISSGLLFHYFENKEVLYTYLIELGLTRMHLDMTRGENAPFEYLNSMVAQILTQLKSDTFFARMFVFMDHAQHTEGIPECVKERLKNSVFFEQCRSIIEKGQMDGVFRAGNSYALCAAFLGSIQGIAQEIVRIPSTPLPEVRWIMDILAEREDTQ